ncbi:DUF4862 family protein [Agrococcus jejuensis]|uniref:DUF4862 family protein n=1 Tax=Agrococcus jejuensis TaxID=399736 RepID=UPI0011A34B11|nr:DUF4862 family protein [Agrococcus jejuensis]
MADGAHASTGWLVGAYAAAPSRIGWDPDAERRFLDALGALPGVVGLELPWAHGAFHLRDEGWMLERIPSDAQIVVTTAPDTSNRHRASSTFGLASTDEDGRRDAIEATRALHAALPRLRASVPVVSAVELHGAPRATPGASSASALRESLAEIAGWDWGGARLVVEHCDAWVPTHAPAKGYLALDDELAVVHALRDEGVLVGISVNWGRSVIEQRDPDAGRAHAALAAARGVLDGIVLSGAAPVATPVGGAWADVHAPFADDGAYAGSLLTVERAAATIEAAGHVAFRAVKVGAPSSASVDERIAVVARAIAAAQGVDALVR